MSALDFTVKIAEPIRTERLTLRAPAREDVAAMAALANNKRIHKWLSRLPHPYGESDAIDFIDNKSRSAESFAFSVVLREIGFIGVTGFHLEAEDRPELGYWLGEPHWGNGYATEAMAGLLNAVAETGCTKLFARALSENGPSRRVLEKSGFKKTGSEIGMCGTHLGVSITSYEWEPER